MSEAAGTTTRRTRLSLEEKLLLGAIGYFVLLRLVFVFGAFPLADEPYYWLWGRHLALSYYDHPPLQGWLQGLSYLVFGRSLFALRWMTIAAFIGIVWIIALVTRRIAGDGWRPVFLRGVTAYLGAPLFGFFGTMAFHDYLLVFLVMASGYLFVRYFADIEEGLPGRLPHLLGAAVLLGLAALTKYNGAFLGLAVAGTVLVRPRLRPLLLRWPIYGAAAIAIGLQAPVVLWNLEEGFASFAFQMGSRHGTTGFTGINISGMLAFTGEALLMVSPFLVPAIVLSFIEHRNSAFERIGKTLAIWAFWLSTLTCLYISNFSWVIWYWNIVAFVLVFPFVGRTLRGWLLWLHAGWGIVINTTLTVTFVVVPVLALLGRPPAMESERSYGLDGLVAAVTEARAKYDTDFIASNHYITASQVAWLLDDPDIVELGPRRTAFDDWFDPATRAGDDAIVIVEPSADTEAWKAAFARVTDLGEVRAERFGHLVNTYRLWLAEDFAPLDVPASGP